MSIVDRTFRGCFSRPGGPHDAQKLALLNFKRNMVKAGLGLVLINFGYIHNL